MSSSGIKKVVLKVFLNVFTTTLFLLTSCNNQKQHNLTTDFPWTISCGVDEGAIIKEGTTITFQRSQNYCDGQSKSTTIRSETISPTFKNDINQRCVFESYISLETKSDEKLSLFQIHDSRMNCAPLLTLLWMPNNRLAFESEYFIQGESPNDSTCITNDIETFYKPHKLNRNGDGYQLKVKIDFEKESAFSVSIFIDGNVILKGQYEKAYINMKKLEAFQRLILNMVFTHTKTLSLNLSLVIYSSPKSDRCFM